MVGVVGKVIGEFAIGIAGKMIAHFPQVFVQPHGRVLIQVDKDKTFPGVAVDRRQTVFRFAETGRHPGFLLGADEFTFIVIGPGMETATEGRLLTEVVPFTLRYDDRVPPVRAGIMKRTDPAVPAPDQQHAGAGKVQPFEFVTSGLR